MLHAVPLNSSTRHTRGLVRVVRRRFATGTPETVVVPKGQTVAAPIPEPVIIPKKKSRVTFSRIFFTTVFATGTFYVGSLFLSFKSPDYYDFFSDNVPLGQAALEFGEARKWDRLVTSSVPVSQSFPSKASLEQKLAQTKAATEKKIANTKATLETKAHDLGDKAKHVQEKLSTQVHQAQHTAGGQVEKVKDKLDKAAGKAAWIARSQAGQVADEVADLKAKAESALRGEYPADIQQALSSVKESAAGLTSAFTPRQSTPVQPVYPELPIGFEPPLGYSAPKSSGPSRPATDGKSKGSLRSDPTPLPGSVPYPVSPETPKASATASPQELEKRLHEAERLLDQQIAENNVKLIEYEMSANDALDIQEANFRRALNTEREQIAQMYTQKLEGELHVQQELIEERLKESLAQQSIELQRRWIREIKVLVEQERGGRLSKIAEIQTKLKALESVALENAEILDDAARSKALLSAVDVFKRASLHSPVKKNFREELRTLRALALETKDELMTSALSTLDSSNTPDVGVEPLPDLTAWFSTSVSPKAAKMALVPSQDAGLLTHIASSALSMLTFRRLNEGQLKNRVDGGGDDVLSTLARAEWYLKTDSANGLEGLEKATRELNQLPHGPSREICEDWLAEARRRLEVGLLIETLEALATVKALLYSA